MPYVSKKQRAYLHANEPALAAKWDRETGGKIVPGGRKAAPKMKTSHRKGGKRK